jgi:hypothetical protein
LRSRLALLSHIGVGTGLALATSTFAVSPAHAQSSPPPACAATADATTPATPAPGAPCWTEVDPYPFGDDGEAVDPTSDRCRPRPDGAEAECYLTATSFAFRAWNRGIAATSKFGFNGQLPASGAFGVWLFNGTRWYPDPTFPGRSTCPGDTVVWAGKLDYWLIGPARGMGPDSWPRLCRYDGANFTWQPLDVPEATKRRVRLGSAADAPNAHGAIRTAACFAWNNCWLFGDYGAVVHWDGNALRDASPNPNTQQSLTGAYTAAATGVDAAGKPFGLAVGATYGGVDGSVRSSTTLSKDGDAAGPVQPQPNGSPPPQAFASHGGAFAPIGIAPPTISRPDDPNRTDLVAAALGAAGRGWVAGHPSGFYLPGSVAISRRSGRLDAPEPSPVVPVSSTGARTGCAGAPADRFTWMPSDAPTGQAAYLWTSLAVFPESGDALVGGAMRPAAAGTSRNDDGSREPVLVRVSCDGTVTETRFRVPDPTRADGTPVAAARLGRVTSVAATARNDAWAATTQGLLKPAVDGDPVFPAQRPHLYRFTDTTAPLAEPGDDREARPPVIQPDPPIFVVVPPPPEPPPPPPPKTIHRKKKPPRRVKQKPSVYHVRTALRKTGRSFTLYITFKVRRPVTIGVQALRRNKVVSSSGLKRFRGKRGTLALKLSRDRWPTRVRFITKKPKRKRSAVTARVRIGRKPAW